MVKFWGFCAASDRRPPPTVSNSSDGTGCRGLSDMTFSSVVETAQHHPGDVLERCAVRIGLADQAQALDAGGEKAGELHHVGIGTQLAALRGRPERVAAGCFHPPVALGPAAPAGPGAGR